jgi:predicted O-methyltransferase YrrM
MRVFGLMVVRNEADILHLNLLHHLNNGIDQLLVIDNGSTDSTPELLARFSRTGRVAWLQHDGAFRQAEMITALASEAYLRGSDWVIPIDADEFWYAPAGDLRALLESSKEAALEIDVVNFIQRRAQTGPSPDALLHMTRRAPQVYGPVERIAELVETQQAAFVEIQYPSKWISRATAGLQIGVGNHSIAFLNGPRAKTGKIVCLHAPLRSRAVLEARVPQAERYRQAGNNQVWHVFRWERVAGENGLDREWASNSYEDDSLDVDENLHPVVFDARLRDLVAPWVDRSLDVAIRQLGADGADPLHLSFRLAAEANHILNIMDSIEGWLTRNEASLLAGSAALALMHAGPAPIVEIGSYLGRSTVVLASVVANVDPDSKVYAIDPHEGELTQRSGSATTGPSTFDDFRSNIHVSGLSESVETIRDFSYNVCWNRPLAMLFVDGFHDYFNVKRDFTHFETWIRPGGYVAFHDCDVAYPGVQKFVDELLAIGSYELFQRVDSMAVLRKSGPMSVENGDSTNESFMRTENQRNAERLLRLEKGEALLRSLLQNNLASYTGTISQRDRTIRDLQAELHAKIGECNRIIGCLQTELQAKVGDCNRVLADLRAELDAKTGERDQTIRELQASLNRMSSNPDTRRETAFHWILRQLRRGRVR